MASAVAKPFDVADDVASGLILGEVGGAVNALIVEGGEERFRLPIDAPMVSSSPA